MNPFRKARPDPASGPERRPWRRLAIVHDTRGIAAVEFALIFPFLLMLFFGTVEVSQAVALNRLVSLASSTVANLVTQYSTISMTQQLPDVLAASTQVLAPNPAGNAKVVVSSLSIDGTGKATVTWSQPLNAVARPIGQVVTLPTSLAAPNTTIILSEVTYTYHAAFDFMKLGALNLKSATYMVPRASTTITLAP